MIRCLLTAAAGCALVLVAGCGSGSGTAGTVSRSDIPNPATLTYVAEPYGAPVTPDEIKRTVGLLRERLRGGGLKGAVEARPGRIVVTVPAPITGRTVESISRTAELYFYDWEPNVVGPDGNPAPAEGRVTGDSMTGGAAGVTSGLTQYQAVLRAAKRPPILRASDTTYTPGCTPEQHGCIYGSWYLIDTAHQRMLCGNATATCPPQSTDSGLLAGYTPPSGSRPRAVRVNPGTIIVRARPPESSSGRVTNDNPNSWYVLNDDPVLSGADLTNPVQGFDEGTGGNGRPNVTFGFTPRGKEAFEKLTHEVAHRGQEAQLPGVAKEAAEQHFAVVLDGQIITAPSIDYTRYPEGIDANNGSQISGGFTVTSARALAHELLVEALPVRLRRVTAVP